MSDTPMTDEDYMPIDQALGLAKLWRAGKMIGGDPYYVCASLLRELAAVTAERDRMRPVVEAAQNFRRPGRMAFWDGVDAIHEAVDAYEAQK